MIKLLSPYQDKKIKSKIVELYAHKKALNAAFSLRAFSKKLGVSSGALSEILKNKRRVSILTARKILQNISMSSLEIESFFNEKEAAKNLVYNDLTLDQYEVLSSWHSLALLNYLELPHESHVHKTIALKFSLNVKKVDELICRLIRLGMIKKEKGKYVRTFVRYQTSEDISNSAIIKYHLHTLELSERVLKEVDITRRDFSSMVLKINPKNLKKVKDIIRECQDEIASLVEEDDPSEIYHMNVHLYPVTF